MWKKYYYAEIFILFKKWWSIPLRPFQSPNRLPLLKLSCEKKLIYFKECIGPHPQKTPISHFYLHETPLLVQIKIWLWGSAFCWSHEWLSYQNLGKMKFCGAPKFFMAIWTKDDCVRTEKYCIMLELKNGLSTI